MIRHKFNAKPTECDGYSFGSKKEAKHYQSLILQQKNGEVLFFLMQVPFRLPGKVIYRADFMVFRSDGTVTVEEVKGFETDLWKTKRKIVEDIYNINIIII